MLNLGKPGAPRMLVPIVGLATFIVALNTSCLPLFGFLFTADNCDLPGVCGVPGHLLGTTMYDVNELSHQPGLFISNSSGYAFTNLLLRGIGNDEPFGITFVDLFEDEQMVVATSSGINFYDSELETTDVYKTVKLDDCLGFRDVEAIGDHDLVVACIESRNLIRLDAETGTPSVEFECCAGLDAGFDPSAVAVSPDESMILAGTSAIHAFDAETGALIDIVVPDGVEGATSYDDFVFGPSGNLFVSANPNIGVLEFDGQDFTFLRSAIPPSESDGIPEPRALAFRNGGTLMVASFRPGLLREFNADSGARIATWFNEVTDDIGAYDYRFMVVRP